MASRNGTTKRDTTANPTRLYLSTKREGGYFHLNATVVEIRPDDDYSVKNWGKVRNVDMSNGRFVDDLYITSQGSDEDRTRSDQGRQLYAWEIEYHTYSVRLDRAERMVKTLKAIEKDLARMTAKLGRPLSFGQYLGRIAISLGCLGFVVKHGKGRGEWGYDAAEHRFLSIADGIEQADFMVHEWVTEGLEAATLPVIKEVV